MPERSIIHMKILPLHKKKFSYDNALLLDDHSRVKLIPDMVLSLDECREGRGSGSGAVPCPEK